MSGRLRRERSYETRHSSPPPSVKKPSRVRNNPPSRHLWVGNLADNIDQATLVDQLIRFGELESVAFQPGRSYAFVNFSREDDAVAALKSLQGFSLAGLPLRVEFAKSSSDKSPASRVENCYQQRDELHPPNRRSACPPRESRTRYASPNAVRPDSSRTSDTSTERPSEILWIGFPAFLKVDETILRKAFSPFGDIDKITVFSGRTYAFVQFNNLASACRAKETLQGKLFGNPRVHIRFARDENASLTGERQTVGHNVPLPSLKPNGQSSSDSFCPGRSFGNLPEDLSTRSHILNMEYGEPEVRSFHGKEPSWIHANHAYDRRLYEHGPEVGVPQRLPNHGSPSRAESAHFHEISSRQLPRESAFPADPWDLPEDDYIYRDAKKMKTNSFPCEDLPEYPFDHTEQGKHILPKVITDFSLPDNARLSLPYRELSEHPANVNPPLADRYDSRKPFHDTLLLPPPFASNPIEQKRSIPELHRPGMKEEWKWEGIIAKGGTSVCRARCFPVGKIMDIFLPEFLDCTARTGLDMLAKHYYNAASSWVVFFVAASDADMGYYNDFMHYLGDKQRAAVAKLDERHTMFLVPPSDFSENVLKVPGKLSISGVVLSLEPSSPRLASLPQANETMNRSLIYPQRSPQQHKLESSLNSFSSSASISNPGQPMFNLSSQRNVITSAPSSYPNHDYGVGNATAQVGNDQDFELVHHASYPNLGKPAVINLPSQGNMITLAPSSVPEYSHGIGSVSDQVGNGHNHPLSYRASAVGPTLSAQLPEGSVHSSRNLNSHSVVSQNYQDSVSGRAGLETSGGIYNSGGSGVPSSGYNHWPFLEQNSQVSAPLPLGGLRAEQQAHLISSLPDQRGQISTSSSQSAVEITRPVGNMGIQPESQSGVTQRHDALQTNQSALHISTSAFSQLQHLPQADSHAAGVQSSQDESETDPQKRLQATLRLAAALLQQIQQGKGT